jgi:hypothetical protein
VFPFVAGNPRPKPSGYEAPDFAGQWRNQRGSEMGLVVSGASLRGAYRTAVGEPRPGETFDLVGFVNGDLIAFTVDFGAYGCVAAWAGQHTVEEGEERIHTLWYLPRNLVDADEHRMLWAGMLAGADTFTRVYPGGSVLLGPEG